MTFFLSSNGIILHLDCGRKCSINTCSPGSTAFIFTWTLLSHAAAEAFYTSCAPSFFILLISYWIGLEGVAVCVAPLWTVTSCWFCGQPLDEPFFFRYYLKSHMDSRQAWLITLHPSDFKRERRLMMGPIMRRVEASPAVKRTERVALTILKPL